MSLRDACGFKGDGDDRDFVESGEDIQRQDSLSSWIAARNGGPLGLLSHISTMASADEIATLYARLNGAAGIRRGFLGMLRAPEMAQIMGSAAGPIEFVACRHGTMANPAMLVSAGSEESRRRHLLRLPGNGFVWVEAIGELRQHDLFPYMMIATALLDRFRSIAESRFLAPLTPRQRECIMWTALGKTSGEIGGILGLSENTVNNYIASSTVKLGAVNKTHLIHLCLGRTGLPQS